MTHDPVNHPSHYMGNGMESIEVIEGFHLGFHLGNVFKYLIRHKRKNGREDVKKALWYLKRFQADIEIMTTQAYTWLSGGHPDMYSYNRVRESFKLMDKEFVDIGISYVITELLYLQVNCTSLEMLEELLDGMIAKLENWLTADSANNNS